MKQLSYKPNSFIKACIKLKNKPQWKNKAKYSLTMYSEQV